MIVDERTERIIAAAIAVHRALGPGLLESTYSTCLAIEMAHRGIPFRREVAVPVVYRGIVIDATYRIDFLVLEDVVVENKSVEKLNKLHLAQALTYMRLGPFPVGLLLNFNVPMLRDGIVRLSL